MSRTLSSYFANWISLRKKITGLALIPALACSAVFGVLIWYASGRTAKLVGEELTRFMEERTARACIHGYNTSIVTYGYVMDALKANSATARLMLEKTGGVHLNPARTASWQAVNSETQRSNPIIAPELSLGAWKSAPNTTDPGPLHDIAAVTGRAVVLFERIDAAGDMMRVAGASPQSGANPGLGSYIPAQLADATANPMIATILSGRTYQGRSEEFGSWHTVVCDALRQATGEIFGMVCVGLNNDGIRSLEEELKANYVGARGSVAVFYGHGKDRGKMLLAPDGVAAETQAQWFPILLDESTHTKDQEINGTIVRDAVTGANVIVRFTYFERWDWEIVVIADSRDLQKASDTVSTEFHGLKWRTFIAGLVFLVLTVFIALRLSKRLIDPMVDLTIRLTSNATQIASSARQQASNVASFNTSGNEIASAVKEISATSKELLRSMEQLAEDAERTSAVANEGSQGLKGLGSSMGSLADATHSIADKLNAIRLKANKINAVVTVITKVADQTNLLSLNAAIEAEKAGENGAGFAVVAREIRRLADQSAIATMEIEQMVEAMQEAVSTGVAQTRDLTEAMQRGIAASEGISGQFGDIIHRVESMAPRYEAVHQGMQNQSEGAHQISEAMWQLTEMGRQTSDSVNDLNEVSKQLHGAVRILKERIIQVRGR
ncbi:Cache 3/Cache 2 fusion domain-containing protein [Granulicella rosea]|uniref:Cache 3/Cache 2 fusion domain-containing protein n=1 Tax=Granulicella rosea TaxID=474952 RepID=A0A239HNJ9_9BACT|nr:Cache 3/Cache 2 fusion domain-containing protein [Granulicella rosea]SNS82483.1 Cache 3/Cache 2 fusion domain-containing protein [Granulicella rosea]